MVSYEVIISPGALDQLDRYLDYIQYTLQNPIAAERVWKDAVETKERLAVTAGSLKYCDYPVLRSLGYRAIGFQRHRYVMLYRVEEKTAYVDGIYHQIQDYENLFSTQVR